MKIRRDAAELWAQTVPRLVPGEVVLASFAPEDLARVVEATGPLLESFAAIVVERDELSVTIALALWPAVSCAVGPRRVAGPFRAITLDLAIDLGVCGFFLPAADRLARARIPVVPQCAYEKDHLLVRSEHAERAMSVLNELVDEARARLR